MNIKITRKVWHNQIGERQVMYSIWKDGVPFKEYSELEFKAFMRGLGVEDGQRHN